MSQRRLLKSILWGIVTTFFVAMFLGGITDSLYGSNQETQQSSTATKASSQKASKKQAKINKLLAKRLKEEKGYDADWAQYVDKISYSVSNKQIKVTLNGQVAPLTKDALNKVGRMSQGAALNVLNENGVISNEKAMNGMRTQWILNGDIVGYTGIGAYHTYHWNINN